MDFLIEGENGVYLYETSSLDFLIEGFGFIKETYVAPTPSTTTTRRRFIIRH